MLKKCPFLFILLAVRMASAATLEIPKDLFVEQDLEGCYLLKDKYDLYWFANKVNTENTTYATACAKLTADIVVNTNVLTDGQGTECVALSGSYEQCSDEFRNSLYDWTPIGSLDNPFAGTFDGQGHTISGLFFNEASSEVSNVGLFGTVDYSGEEENVLVSISNVGIEDSYFKAGNAVGGVIGSFSRYIEGNVETWVVKNVYNAAVVVGSTQVGGIIGYVALEYPLTMVNVYNVGSIICTSPDEVGGLVGSLSSSNAVSIKNSYNYGNVVGVEEESFVNGDPLVGQIDVSDEGTVTNSFTIGESKFEGKGATQKSATDFSNGTVFAALRNAEDGEVWRQYKNDAYPTFAAKTGTGAPSPMHVATLHYSATDSVAIPYTEGSALMLPTTLSDGSIVVGWYKSDDLSGDTYTQIAATENGDLNFYAKAMKLDSDGYYEIADADMLFKFADLVNNQNKTYATACAKLTADIVVNENVLTTASGTSNVNANGEYIGVDTGFRVWTPIGANVDGKQNSFSGSFDGQGHTISGLYFNDSSADNVGLFGYTSGAVTIEGVGVEDSYFRGGQNVGSIVGQAASEGTKELTVTRSFNKGAVTGTDNVGGLVGKNGNVKFSYNKGSVTGTSNVGGLVGSNTNSFEINGSYNVGLVKNGAGSGNAVLGSCPTDVQYNVVRNIYYLEGSGDKCLGAYSMTSYEFADGFVATMLHNDNTTAGANIWGQIVGADKTPLLTGEIVFPITLDNSDNCYEISNADDLYIFAAIVNSGFKSDACGKLTENIVVNENVLTSAGELNIASVGGFKEWTPIGFGTNSIGQNISFRGTFHGQGHTISGLYFNDTYAEDVGLFGDVNGTVTIDSVGLVDSYIMAGSYVGGLVGFARGSLTISDSYNASSVTSFNTFGGLVGAAGSGSSLAISNSYNVGSLNGGGYGGGLVGYADALVVSNSYNAGAIYNSDELKVLVGGITSSVDDASTVTNSFNYGTISYPSNIEVVVDDLVAEGGEGIVIVTNSFSIGTSRFDGDESTKKSVTEFANGIVFAALRGADESGSWYQYQGDDYPILKQKTGDVKPMHVATLRYSDTDSTFIAYVEGVGVELPTKDKEGKALSGWTTSEDGTGDVLTEIPTSATGDLKLYPKAETFVPNAEGYYEIATADDLYKFAAIVNNGTAQSSGTALGVKAKLMNDICVNACGEGESVLGTDNANVDANGDYIGSTTGLREWIPIGFGKDNENIVSFNGLFDGQGHSISGLYFNKADAQYVGLFGTLSTATIKNVGVEDSYFKGSDCIGGILGIVDIDASVNIENVYNAAVVVGGIRAGGIIGGDFGNESHVTNAYNVGMVLSIYETAGGIVGYNYSVEPTTIQNSFNYGSVSAGSGMAGALIGEVEAEDDAAGISVSNSYYLGDAANGGYGEYKSASDFENGTVLSKLREQSRVWVQSPGDKYPTIDINASPTANIVVLDWSTAADSTTLAAAGYSGDDIVVVKDGKQFYAGGAIYEGILSADQVAEIGGNKLYPISGVELETVGDKLVAILDGMDREEGGTAPAFMIPFDLVVDKVIYKRKMIAGIYQTVMLPFDISSLKPYKDDFAFYNFTRMDENVAGYRYMAMVYRVGKFKANMPYIVKNLRDADADGIVFEGPFTLNTVSSGSRESSATSDDGVTWSMKGVYENKVWETGDSEIGSAYLFAGQEKDGYKIGEFAKLGAGSSLQPMRMYLLKESLAKLERPGLFGSVNHYGSPESIGVMIVDSEEFDESEETMVEKRITVIPTVIKSNRWYDMQGRVLDSKPTAKGNYYYNGKRITIK